MTLSRAALAGLFLAVGISGCGKSSQQPAAPAVAPTELAALKTPPPEYSPQLACAGIGGTSVLRVVVGVEGTPTDVSVSQSSGQPVLDEAAQNACANGNSGPPRATARQCRRRSRCRSRSPPVPRPDECFAIEERARRGG